MGGGECVRYVDHDCFLIVCQENASPRRYSVQGIKTFPTLCLAQRPDILQFYALQPDDLIDIYQVSAYGWQSSTVRHVFTIKTNQLLLIRRAGVKVCPGIDAAITESRQTDLCAAPVLTSNVSVRKPRWSLAGQPASHVLTMHIRRRELSRRSI